MRLDLFLKSSRLVIRRSVAKEMCDAGMIFVNGQAARSSKEIKPGDEIEIRRRDDQRLYRIEKLPETKQTSKADAPALTTLVSETRPEDDLLS
ncbi:MAG: RNA-binding S4 domain-containing protein [Pyrinomonadaceae bacterium]|nr:RNA-binding S4 domain-containing protein [Pyrinomonadaceae bacterium]